jgi:hypothetical protein
MLRRVEYSSLNRRNPLLLVLLGNRHPIPLPDIVRELCWAGAKVADIQLTAGDQNGLNSEKEH